MSLPAQASSGKRWLAFAVLCAMQLMVVVDISIVTVSLRSIQSDLGLAEARLAWITNAYTIGFGGLLLLSGRLGDLIGRKRMFVSGLALFTVASALCGASQTSEMLITMRFLQGIGAAMAHAVIMSIIFTIFSNPAELGKAMGISGFGQAAPPPRTWARVLVDCVPRRRAASWAVTTWCMTGRLGWMPNTASSRSTLPLALPDAVRSSIEAITCLP
jgi:MFS family permease